MRSLTALMRSARARIVRQRPRQHQLGLQPQAGQRRAQLMGRMADEAPLRRQRGVQAQQQVVGVRDQRLDLDRHAGHFQRLHVVDGTLADLFGQMIHRAQARAHALHHHPGEHHDQHDLPQHHQPEEILQHPHRHLDLVRDDPGGDQVQQDQQQDGRHQPDDQMPGQGTGGAAGARPERRREECVPASWRGPQGRREDGRGRREAAAIGRQPLRHPAYSRNHAPSGCWRRCLPGACAGGT